MDYEKKYLQLLKEKYTTKAAVLTEIINLEAILHLPKGTEHFVSDLHGEYGAFQHILRTGSGAIKEKINELFGENLTPEKRNQLAMLVYYPEEVMKQETLDEEFFKDNLEKMILLTRYCGKKYSRSKVRKALPEKYAYILEELLTEIKKEASEQKNGYCQAIVEKIICLGQAEDLIIGLGKTISRLVVDQLHVVGDIYDRGPAPDKIMDALKMLPAVDIQWGNHDINWMGAVAGSPLSMINVVRICARYDNLEILEESYGINLRPLLEYATGQFTPTENFAPKNNPDHGELTVHEADTLNCLQQACAVLQFKLEDALIARRPEFQLDQRRVLAQLDFSQQTYTFADKKYQLTDFPWSHFDENQPNLLNAEEEKILQQLLKAFQHSPRLKQHTDFLMDKGGMYLCYNENLLLHGCIPLHENGDFKALHLKEKSYAGKELLDFYEEQVRTAYKIPTETQNFATDLLWYLWCGECSSLFGKLAMTTFERYYVDDTTCQIEEKNAYYRLRNEEKVATDILRCFGLASSGHIINGHTPVKEKRGEDPVKAHGKVLVIDGGFAKSYQEKTGIAGYTLVFNSFGLQLVSHLAFTSVAEVVKASQDVLSTRRLVEEVPHRLLIKETNIGKKLQADKEQLERLFDRWGELS
ncbi:fructose-bisphosphatase class III [Enterococcus timonensis]|uniref:fructose-bisphosphatase class III n=1 Tax=Enterococcus timonensis TaxID=1852364 RepID=UPI0008DAEFF4|nr:fructose-bisphosphatase class III [Enterococcus timonensis]